MASASALAILQLLVCSFKRFASSLFDSDQSKQLNNENAAMGRRAAGASLARLPETLLCFCSSSILCWKACYRLAEGSTAWVHPALELAMKWRW